MPSCRLCPVSCIGIPGLHHLSVIYESRAYSVCPLLGPNLVTVQNKHVRVCHTVKFTHDLAVSTSHSTLRLSRCLALVHILQVLHMQYSPKGVVAMVTPVHEHQPGVPPHAQQVSVIG